MEKFTKEDLAEQAEKFMDAHGSDSFLATEDGNFFHPNDKGLAHDHNNKNVLGEVHVFTRASEEKKLPPTEEEKIEAIKNAIAEMSLLKITDVREIKDRLIKSKFNKKLVEQVLSSINTHE